MTVIDDYLSGCQPLHRQSLQALCLMLRELLPDAIEVNSYAMPGFRIDSGVVAGFAAFKNHVSYFPHSGNIVPQLTPEEVSGYQADTGTLRFPPGEILSRTLVTKLVKLRLQELEEKLATKAETKLRKGQNAAQKSASN